jgi:hypothetical protein
VALLLRDLLSAIRGHDKERVIIGEWGDVLLEAHTRMTGAIDLRGLGHLAFFLLTGRAPVPNTRYVPGAPPALQSLILRMIGEDRPTIRDAQSSIAVMLGGVPLTDSQRMARGTNELSNENVARGPALLDVIDNFDDLD